MYTTIGSFIALVVLAVLYARREARRDHAHIQAWLEEQKDLES